MTKRLWVLLFTLLTCTICGEAADKAAVSQWIVVTAPAFEAAIDPLCDHRRAEGMRVVVVRTTDVLSAEQIHEGDGSLLKEFVHRRCQEFKGLSYVLLVGTVKVDDPAMVTQTVVPALRGTVGRMKGEPSDNGYGCWNNEWMPATAVGRFPARTEEEARGMVQKTLNFEQDGPAGLWRNQLTLIVGNPGGNSAVERQFGEWFVQAMAGTCFSQIHPSWIGRILIHARGSPFCVPDERLCEVSLSYIEEGQCFLFYLGHSNASGLGSADVNFLNREDWAKLNISSGQGIFFTCGCFGCQLNGSDGEGYGLTAMRNPKGPVAVFGAHGESYAAMGQLALDGMLRCLSESKPPPRVADYWLAVKSGLDHGEIAPLTFWMYDQADGSRGKVPLDTQRLEHLEMWVLLGDPALRLPVRSSAIRLTIADTVSDVNSVTLIGSMPSELVETMVRLTIERPIGSLPVDLRPLPKDSSRADVMMTNHKRANAVVLATYEIQAYDGRFEYTLTLPTERTWSRLTVRASASTSTQTATGVLSLSLSK